jgi:hypothetical protein
MTQKQHNLKIPSAFFAGSGVAGAAELPSESSTMIFVLALTAVPSSTRISFIMPLFGENTSIVVLSVSILAIISSALTDSPTYYKRL